MSSNASEKLDAIVISKRVAVMQWADITMDCAVRHNLDSFPLSAEALK